MPKTVPIQDNFAAGEISPRFIAQLNSEVYKHGLQSMINWVPQAQGPFYRRNGFRYHGQVPGTSGRLFPFPITKDYVTFIILTNQNKLYIASPDEIFRDGNIVSNSHFLQGSTDWTDVSQNSGYVTFLTGSAQLVPGSTHPTQDRYAGIKQTLTTVADTEYDIEVVTEPNQSLSNMRIMVGSTDGGSDLLNETIGSTLSHYSGSFDCGSNTTVYLEIRALENDIGALRTLTHINVNDPLSNDLLDFTTPWDANDLDLIQVGYPPGEDKIYFVSPSQPPQELSFDRSTEVWTFQAITFSTPPADWVTNNYPGAITFFQGRMWLGGTPGQPEKFWGSKSASYLDFDTGTSLADEAMSFTMAQKGQILWMVGAKNLLIGTEFGEFIVTSSDGVITPSDIQVDQQSAYGSARIQPIQIGNRILYVSPDRRKIRDMGYKWTDDGWVSRDITFGSEHITGDNALKGMAFGQNPGNILYCVTQTRNMIGGTYERGNDIVGWFNGVTEGEFIALASADLDGTSTMAGLFNRNIESTPTLYFEVCYPAPTGGRCVVDSGGVFGGQSGVTISSISVPHLKGKTVQVIVDGALHPDVTLDSSGNGDLQYTGETVVVGLGYNAYAKLLPLASILQVGQSTLPMMKRYNKIFVRIYDSAVPKINGNRPPTRYPATPMGMPEALSTKDVKVANLSWSASAEIEIEQELPLFTQVAGVFGEAAQELLG